jgi:excisionase family DNA binding protein
MNERWLSVEEIAAHLGVNPDTVYKWIERKKMPAHKAGRLWKFQATEVDAWIRDGRASESVNLPAPQRGSARQAGESGEQSEV